MASAGYARRLLAAALALAVVVTGGFAAQPALAQDDEEPQRETRQVQSLSKELYDKLTKAQEQIDTDNFDGALRIINGVNQSDLSGYERANLLNFLGFIHYSKGDNRRALQAYEQLIAIPEVEPQMRSQVLYTLASLYAQDDNWDKTIEYMTQWFAGATNPSPEAYILMASAYQSKGRYRDTIDQTQKAIAVAREREQQPKESWWNLLYYSYYQLEDFNNVRDVLKTLIRGWPKKAYWLQLGAIYSELGDDKNFLATYEAAFEQGMLESENELVTYAQLLLQQEIPFKAAKVLENGMQSGAVSRTEKNYRLLSQAWSLAQNDEKAIGPLSEAARLSSEGELNVRLAINYLNLDRYDDCVEAARAGLNKGSVKNVNDARMTIGQCLYNQNRYQAARTEFQRVTRSGSERDKKIARQWVSVINSEIERLDQLEAALAQN
ncbi:MAG: tetratricopeptide repeat protein [Pseudomonadota bacterium]